PERYRLSYSKVELKSMLAVMYGGRIAEELVFGKENITTGAGNDIQQATSWARRMVTEFGFSDKLGSLRYADNEEEIFLGHSVTRQKNVSDATAALIDEEVRRLIDEAEMTARKILTKDRDQLEIIAKALLEYETLNGEEVDALLRGESIIRPEEEDPSGEGGRKAAVPTSGKSKKSSGHPGMDPEPQPES
ncbi:MAG: cell division protein FtsH, partial [Proteobacteria bacterium]|nr:cell division protein FtsH [Pseudomonadota bacterium]